MKKRIILLLAGLVGIQTEALADKKTVQKLTPLQMVQVQRAIGILVSTKTIENPYDQCVQFDQDILSILESESLIESGTVQPMVICVDPK